jgi:YD repeat-containing protein
VEVKNGGEVVERYAYGDRGRTVTFTDGKGNSFIQEKNGYGELVEERNRVGDRQQYGYDPEERIQGVEGYSGKEVKTEYEDGKGTTIRRYSDGREADRADDEGAGEKTEYRYDGRGRRTGMTSGNREVRYWYGKNGELLKVEDTKQRLSVVYEYDKMGREVVVREQ